MLRSFFRGFRNSGSSPSPEPARPPVAGDASRRALELYRDGRYGEVVELLEHLPQSAPRDAETLLIQGNALQYERRFAAAATTYAPLIRTLEHAGPQYRSHLASVLIHCGLAHLRMNDFGSAKQLLDRAVQLTPEDPPAVGCARFPDLMQRSLDLRRSPLSPSASARRRWPVPDRPLEIVYFFIGTAGDERFGEYCSLLSASMASARRSVPACRVVLLTDRDTNLPVQVKPDETRRYDLAPAELMVSRFRAVEAYLGEKAARNEAVLAALCDPDVVVNRDLREAFTAEFDVAVTTRSNFVDARLDHEPFTAGVTFVQGRDAQGARRFFTLCLREFDAIAAWPEVVGFYPRPIHEWRGDQLVPAAIVGWRDYAEHVLAGHTDRLEIDGVVVAFLPSDPFCFTFEPCVTAEQLAKKYVIDFKGARKRYMLERFPA